MTDQEKKIDNLITNQRIHLLRELAEKMDRENSVCVDWPPHNLATIAVVETLIGQIAANAHERAEEIFKEKESTNA